MSVLLKGKRLMASSRLARMAKSAEIVAGDDIPVPALEAFYEQMFPARANFLKRNWRWLYRTDSNTLLKSPIVMMKGEEVTGHVGTIPLTLRRGRDERTAAWLCDIAVLSQYRGKALGAFLLTEAMARCPMRIGFPNDLSWRLISKFGWKDQAHTVGLSVLLHPEQHPKIKAKIQEGNASSHGYKAIAALAGMATRVVWRARALSKERLSVVSATPEELTSFHEEQSFAALHTVRSESFLDWRISAHPNVEEHFVLSLPVGHGSCSAIARIVEEDSCRRLHLLTLQVDPFDSGRLSNFLAGVIRWALDQRIDIISTVTSDPTMVQTIKWWLPVVRQLRYAYHTDDVSGEDFLSKTGHMWEYIDGDFDLTYTTPEQNENSPCD